MKTIKKIFYTFALAAAISAPTQSYAESAPVKKASPFSGVSVGLGLGIDSNGFELSLNGTDFKDSQRKTSFFGNLIFGYSYVGNSGLLLGTHFSIGKSFGKNEQRHSVSTGLTSVSASNNVTLMLLGKLGYATNRIAVGIMAGTAFTSTKYEVKFTPCSGKPINESANKSEWSPAVGAFFKTAVWGKTTVGIDYVCILNNKKDGIANNGQLKASTKASHVAYLTLETRF